MVQYEEILERTRKNKPLIHFITNYVTANDCANITLATGASPIMADDVREAEQITELCAALVINIGTLSEKTIQAMITAGKRANKLHRPVILDPAGVGASKLRNETIAMLMRELNFTAIKGNISEMKFLSDGIVATRGVDASKDDLVTEDNLYDTIEFAINLSIMAGSIIIITGPIDIVADGQKAFAIRNGHPLMAEVTGTGCMGGAVIGSYVGANPQNALIACATAICAMGICGELAHDKLCANGNSSYRTLLIDSMSKLDNFTLSSKMKLEQLPSNEDTK